MSDATAVAATVAIAQRLDLVAIPPVLLGFASHDEAPEGSVAVLGLVNRGKSTLINRLVGAPFSAVSTLPETAATILVKRGSWEATGSDEAGFPHELSSDPSLFARQARRDSAFNIVRARISGPFRLPHGLALVDTPGIGEAVGSDSDRLAALNRSWIGSGAGAAVMVVSYPPGIAAQDVKLYETAAATFPGAVAVVCKATSSDVDPDQLTEVAETAEEMLGVPVLVVGDEASSAPWGEGPLASLEREIDRLSGIATARRRTDEQCYLRFVEELCKEILTTTMADLPLLEETVAMADASLSEYVTGALRLQRDRLLTERTAAADLERQRSERDRLRVLDRSAERLIAAITRAGGNAGGLYRELLALAKDGSDTAAQALQRLCHDQARLKASGLTLTEILKALPESKALVVCRDLQREPAELVRVVLQVKVFPPIDRVLAQRALVLVEKAGDLDQAKLLADKVLDPGVRRAANTLVGRLYAQCLDDLVKRGPSNSFDVYWNGVTSADDRLLVWLNADPARGRTSGIDSQRTATLAAFAMRAAPWLAREFKDHYARPVESYGEWLSRSRWYEQAAQWLLSLSDAADDGTLQAWWNYSADHAERWAAAGLRQVEAAQSRVRSVDAWWEFAYVASFVLWAVSVVVLFDGAGAASVVLWLVSLVMWLVARTQRDVDRSWLTYWTP